MMYWTNRDKTEATFAGRMDHAAATSTRADADGYYTYGGRSDDMLKVSGIYVSPFEVEATLMQHPAVLEAAVIGKQDCGRAGQDARPTWCFKQGAVGHRRRVEGCL